MMSDPVPSELEQVCRSLIRMETAWPGIYFLCLEGCLVYVGKSVCVPARIHSHVRASENNHPERIVFDSVFMLPCDSNDLVTLESALIRRYQPPANRSGLRVRYSEHEQDVLSRYGFEGRQCPSAVCRDD